MLDELRIGIVGGGLMGHGIAQVLAGQGATVTVHDPDEATLQAVPDRIASNLEQLGRDPTAATRVHLADTLDEAAADADWVFEAAPERMELKQAIFERLDQIAPADAILATNTSVMRITEIAQRTRNAGRVVGTHWWNPPYLIPLVEVIQGERTAPETVTRTMALLEQAGKTPVHVKRDVPGFIGNRLQSALWRQALELVDAGVCDAEAIDTVVKASFGIRLPVLGPMENADLIGLDLTLDIHEYVLPTLDPPSQPAAGLRERVQAGDLGMKTGAGYRRWTAEEADAVRRRLLAHLSGAAPTLQGGEGP
jgi:3-hydroxybutyryl-CoA dehydrogenase